ncbi:MAG TPA: hypothetical protein VFG04_21325 [Planctomycetaceae bacterium]|nr:hypothetical protein [Planctomycetaceae bacterium]
MQPITRREFSQQAIGSLLTYSLLETLFAHDAFAARSPNLRFRGGSDHYRVADIVSCRRTNRNRP